MNGTLEDLSGKPADSKSLVAAVGQYPKKLFDKTGLDLTEGQSLLAATGIAVATGGAVLGVRHLMNRDKDDGQDPTVEVPNGLPTTKGNGQGIE